MAPLRVETITPAASARTHLLLAALMWTVVGCALAGFGCWWLWRGWGALGWLAAAACLVVGELKSRFVLRRAARRIIQRIESRGDGRCIGGFLSVRTWLLVGLMMGAGYWLRHGLAPRPIVGLIYVAVGGALASASRELWGAWRPRMGSIIE